MSSMTVGELQTLRAKLATLIRNEGLTLRRLELDGEEILSLLGTDDPQQAYDMIVSALSEMEDDDYTQALKNALGVGYSKKKKLTERRAEWIDYKGNSISEDTLRRWERKASDALSLKLGREREKYLMATALTGIDAPAFSAPGLLDLPPAVVPATLQKEIDGLKRQVAEQTALIQKIMEKLGEAPEQGSTTPSDAP